MIKIAILLVLFCVYALVLAGTAPTSFYLIASSFDASKGYVFGSQFIDLGIGCLFGGIATLVFTRLNRLRKFWNKVVARQRDQ